VPLAVLRDPQRRDPGGSDAPSCRPRRGARRQSPAPVFCDPCGTSDTSHPQVNVRSASPRSGLRTCPFSSPAAEPRFASCPSLPLIGRTSSPASRSPCTRTEPWPAPQSFWRFTALPPPSPRDDTTGSQPSCWCTYLRTWWSSHRSTPTAEYSPRTLPPISTRGCGCWPCTTSMTWPTPSRTPCASASTTCPPDLPTTPAADGCGSSGPGPGPGRSPPAGSGSPPSQPSPDDRPQPRRRPGRSRTSTLREPWNPDAAAATREGPARNHAEQTGRTDSPVRQSQPLTNRG
jgi:hypothetical protein